MKYGERLNSYSVPEWRTHNLLYDELKHEIRELTETPASFNRRSYEQLVASFTEEIKSVNLFVNCKLGEIQYRFTQIRADLQASSKEIHKLNLEIYNLSRFITAQFTGFKKLLKKFKRHAPPEELRAGRDLKTVDLLLREPDSFASVDLSKQFLELAELYIQVRRIRDTPNSPNSGANGPLSARKLVAFDVEMLTSFSNSLCFWVHDDNLVQLKVHILQYMDLVCGAEMGGQTSIVYYGSDAYPMQRRTARLAGQDASCLLVPVSLGRYAVANPDQEQSLISSKNPISEVKAECTRFRFGEVWACIYSNLVGSTKFPYSVLEIRSQATFPWLESLKESHLVHPVPGFSLPEWAADPAMYTTELAADIRRVPPPTARKSKSKSKAKAKDSRNNETETEFETEPETEPESEPQFRYWNEFDDPEDEDGQFLDEIDEELRRARTAARLAQPVYLLGASMRRKLHNWFERYDRSSDLESVTSIESRTSDSDEHTPLRRAMSGQFSPRLSSRASYGSVDDIEPPSFERNHSDAALALITFLCFCLSLAVVLLVFTILMTEDLLLLPVGLRVSLVMFLVMALSLAMLGYVANNFRSSPGWLSQAAVHTALLCVVCMGVGGVTNILIPQ